MFSFFKVTQYEKISKRNFYQKNRIASHLAENGPKWLQFWYLNWMKVGSRLYFVSWHIAEILHGEAFNKHHKLHLEKNKNERTN